MIERFGKNLPFIIMKLNESSNRMKTREINISENFDYAINRLGNRY